MDPDENETVFITVYVIINRTGSRVETLFDTGLSWAEWNDLDDEARDIIAEEALSSILNWGWEV
jgi:hypothetical protein